MCALQPSVWVWWARWQHRLVWRKGSGVGLLGVWAGRRRGGCDVSTKTGQGGGACCQVRASSVVAARGRPGKGSLTLVSRNSLLDGGTRLYGRRGMRGLAEQAGTKLTGREEGRPRKSILHATLAKFKMFTDLLHCREMHNIREKTHEYWILKLSYNVCMSNGMNKCRWLMITISI